MTPKKKEAASSSETSSSNSSSSTTSSSSSTESDSSSSDTDNSSSSGGAKSAQASSDSDKKPTPKKKAVTSSVKNKSGDATNETLDKSKEKPGKAKALQKQVYSSESDESPKPNLKRKPPTKPKASATVTPLGKPGKAGGGASKGGPAPPPAKGAPPPVKGSGAPPAIKGSGVPPSVKGSSAAPPAKGGGAPPPIKGAGAPPPTKGGGAPPPAKKVAIATKRTSQRGTTKEPSLAKPYANVPKLEEQKQLKTKSIFSPDNSTDSDDDDDDDTSTPPPPKLTAMKTAATKALKAKPRTKSVQSDKSRASSVSSNSSVTSNSSGSSSESSGGHSLREKGTRNSNNSSSGGGGGADIRTKGGRRSSSSGGGGGSNQQQQHQRRDKKWNTGSNTGSAGPPQLLSDSDTATRKQTRSANTRRSKHIAASATVTSRVISDSDSDTVGSKASASKSPVKKAGPKGPASRKIKGQNSNEASHLIEYEERRCPLECCDSLGHLGGKAEKHFTIEACPIYHRMSANECKEALAERRKREEERKKGILTLKPSHLTSPTPEQKLYREKVKELRSKPNVKEEGSNDSDSGKDRQPDLSRCCNKYDLRLFQEAQAVSSEMIEDELKLLANVRGTKYIEMGKFEMEVWYQSPYPEDYARLPKLYICEFCLRYMKSQYTLERHAAKCVWRHPPGEEVYRKEKISVWEVDGKRYKLYCQNLCLLAKFFLDHKTLYYDVEPFLFYVMTISDIEGCHTVGYFSKEKNSFLNYNVSCILTLPPYQRKGYGRLLIDFSYLLTRVENKVGSPEKPLSDLGLISYRSYWKDVLLEYLCNLTGKQLSIKDMSQEMAINAYDIVSTLQALGMMKYWKGKHIVLKKQDVIEEHKERSKRRGLVYKEIDPECLKWTPFVSATPPQPS